MKYRGSHEIQSKIPENTRGQFLNHNLKQDTYNLIKEQYINTLLKERQI
jgi:hypothetical protein